jgi:hypothetical protein
MLIRGKCSKTEGECTYSHDQRDVLNARNNLTTEWTRDRATTLHNLESSGWLDGMSEDQKQTFFNALDTDVLRQKQSSKKQQVVLQFMQDVLGSSN